MFKDFNHEGWLATTFNSVGVMLIDAKKWREKNSTPSLLELTAQHHGTCLWGSKCSQHVFR